MNYNYLVFIIYISIFYNVNQGPFSMIGPVPPPRMRLWFSSMAVKATFIAHVPRSGCMEGQVSRLLVTTMAWRVPPSTLRTRGIMCSSRRTINHFSGAFQSASNFTVSLSDSTLSSRPLLVESLLLGSYGGHQL